MNVSMLHHAWGYGQKGANREGGRAFDVSDQDAVVATIQALELDV